MNEPKMDYVLLRGPRTDSNGNKIPVTVTLVKTAEADLSGYSYLKSCPKYEEWVPTNELQLYKTTELLLYKMVI